MKTIRSIVGYEGTEHFVLEVSDEIVKVDFIQQVDDILLTTPDGDLLVSWDSKNFSEDNCLLLKSQDNLKELNNVRCTHFYMKSYIKGKKLKVYLTGQRN